MRKGTTEKGITNLFQLPLLAHIPLAKEEKLGNPAFPIAFSFIFGDRDWAARIDGGAAPRLVQKSTFYEQPCLLSGTKSQYHLVPDSDHNMHMDNPLAFANLIINDLLNIGTPLPVLTVDEYKS